MSAAEIRNYLMALKSERFEAGLLGLTTCEHYRSDLEDEIADVQDALVTAVVTEIAVLRAELLGRQVG